MHKRYIFEENRRLAKSIKPLKWANEIVSEDAHRWTRGVTRLDGTRGKK